MKKNKAAAIAIAAGAASMLLAGCGEMQQLRDLENVTITDPDKVRLVTNVDGYPNIVAICVEGVAFVTTTREDRPVQESPGLTIGWCQQ